jgi:D-glycero-D-manno-heptose 1,7-bisphosphate phosphatase
VQSPITHHPLPITRRPVRRAVFLDRDGVINRCEVRNGKPRAPRRLSDFRLLPGVVAALRALKKARFLLIVVTNQPDIGNGLVERSVVEAMHEKLRRRLPVDEIRMCPHRQDAGCACRKPKPGLLRRAAGKWSIDTRRSFLVGDRSSDIVAGQAVGCYTFFIDRGYAEPQRATPDSIVSSLPAAARLILSMEQGRRPS